MREAVRIQERVFTGEKGAKRRVSGSETERPYEKGLQSFSLSHSPYLPNSSSLPLRETVRTEVVAVCPCPSLCPCIREKKGKKNPNKQKQTKKLRTPKQGLFVIVHLQVFCKCKEHQK